MFYGVGGGVYFDILVALLPPPPLLVMRLQTQRCLLRKFYGPSQVHTVPDSEHLIILKTQEGDNDRNFPQPAVWVQYVHEYRIKSNLNQRRTFQINK